MARAAMPACVIYVGRGVVTTSTYEARALGVFSAMGMMKAAKLAPDAILLPTDFDAYRRYSGLFKAAVRTFTEQVEDRGIDEIYIDLTEVPGEPAEVAARIKAAVSEATGLDVLDLRGAQQVCWPRSGPNSTSRTA